MCRVSPTEPFFCFKQGKEISRTEKKKKKKEVPLPLRTGERQTCQGRLGSVSCYDCTQVAAEGILWAFLTARKVAFSANSRFPRRLLRNGVPPVQQGIVVKTFTTRVVGRRRQYSHSSLQTPTLYSGNRVPLTPTSPT